MQSLAAFAVAVVILPFSTWIQIFSRYLLVNLNEEIETWPEVHSLKAHFTDSREGTRQRSGCHADVLDKQCLIAGDEQNLVGAPGVDGIFRPGGCRHPTVADGASNCECKALICEIPGARGIRHEIGACLENVLGVPSRGLASRRGTYKNKTIKPNTLS